MKNAQSLSINVIIIAALGLVVLFILGMLFFNKTQAFSKGLEMCSTKLGKCENPCNGQEIPNTNCKSPQVCCVRLASEQVATSSSSVP